ncbi:nucleosome assembly protein [Aspergillus novoparasiticus]|uniref:Nucleosome assembly protein n=1 Tax=Aspergillus novoparasiticus TaxID=986946 RepID=A0A5N6FAD6_9EURO|nr:nucleosome assembly protein [Aspergillus novoparasiticus]
MSTDFGASLLDRLQGSEPTEAQLKKMSFLEEKRSRIDVDCLRDNTLKMRDWYNERDAFVNGNDEIKENFWVRVFANAPSEIDQYIMTPDAAALGSTLTNLKVERFELNEQGQGEPRSIRLTFEFRTGEENPFFENEKLVKELYWRRRSVKTADGKTKSWEGLVSEPVRIQWKKDMDLTKGLLDAACDLAEAEKGGKDRKKLPELEKLKNKIVELETTADQEEDEDEDFPLSPAGASFFAFFGYRGNDVSAEESKVATKQADERFAKLSKGETVEDEEEEEDEEFEDIEVFPDGEQLAIAIADDLWPHALELFNRDEGMDIEELEGDVDDEDEDDEDDEEDARPKKKTKV